MRRFFAFLFLVACIFCTDSGFRYDLHWLFVPAVVTFFCGMLCSIAHEKYLEDL